MGLLYTCEGIVRKPLGSVYACVCRVLAVRVMESVLHVGDEVGVLVKKIIYIFLTSEPFLTIKANKTFKLL